MPSRGPTLRALQPICPFTPWCSTILNFRRARWTQGSWLVCSSAHRCRRRTSLVAEIDLVDTSLRDGNQCVWAALGIDTAKALTIAPVMDRVGYKAIDFITSTHM